MKTDFDEIKDAVWRELAYTAFEPGWVVYNCITEDLNTQVLNTVREYIWDVYI